MKPLEANKLGIAFIYHNGERTNYMIDYLGEVYNYKTKKFIKIQTRIPSVGANAKYRYFQGCHRNKKFKLIHSRLKMVTFFPIPNMEFMEVDHIIADLENDSFDNLQWLTKKQNLEKRQFDTPL
jgi:hypothetical protein